MSTLPGSPSLCPHARSMLSLSRLALGVHHSVGLICPVGRSGSNQGCPVWGSGLPSPHSSPPQPFVEIAVKHHNRYEAKKYAPRVTPEQRVKAFILVGYGGCLSLGGAGGSQRSGWGSWQQADRGAAALPGLWVWGALEG